MNQLAMNRRQAGYAVIPAAGTSRRMGRPKLLLPWHHAASKGDASKSDITILEHVLTEWITSDVDAVVLVARHTDQLVADIGRRMGVEVVVPPVVPLEMKVSVQLALQYIGRRSAPQSDDTWLLSPADIPRVTSKLINQVLRARHETGAEVLVPTCGGQPGHPTAFAWSLAGEVEQLAAGEGVNRLLQRRNVGHYEIGDAAILDDMDTPADYERLD